MRTRSRPTNVDAYIDGYPDDIRKRLRALRALIRMTVPRGTVETISYGIPAFALNGKKVVWFAAFKSHIGFYPGAAAIRAFKKDLSGYKTAIGSVRLPLDEPLPRGLVEKIVRLRVKSVRPAKGGRP